MFEDEKSDIYDEFMDGNKKFVELEEDFKQVLEDKENVEVDFVNV